MQKLATPEPRFLQKVGPGSDGISVGTMLGSTVTVTVGERAAIRLNSGEVVFGKVSKARRGGIQLDNGEISSAWRP